MLAHKQVLLPKNQLTLLKFKPCNRAKISAHDLQDDDNSTEELDDDEEKLFCPQPVDDEWRQLFDKFDPEGFGEIPVDVFETALDSRDFVQMISPGKLIILQDRLKQVKP